VNWRAGIEPGIAFAMIALYIWWLRFRFPYAWVAILALMIASHLRKREGFQEIGFRWDKRGSANLWLVLGLIATLAHLPNWFL
jgi:hypothetical protein